MPLGKGLTVGAALGVINTSRYQAAWCLEYSSESSPHRVILSWVDWQDQAAPKLNHQVFVARLTQTSSSPSMASSPSALLKLGQRLTGTVSTYTITKQLGEFIWLGSNKTGETVVIKSARHFRIANERDVLKRFQSRTPYLRPLIDEIVDPADPPAIVLKHLEDELLSSSNAKRMSGKEIKYVSKRILEALKVLHEDGYVHTDIKMDNVMVNYASASQRESEQRFTDVQLADLESTVHVTSRFCKNRDGIGTPIWRSPEAQLGIEWGPPTDVWSFGTMVISMIWGENFFIFKPKTPRGHEDYELDILAKYHIYFGPYPPSYCDLANKETLMVLTYVMDTVPPEKIKPFSLASQREISTEDKEFILRIMKLDPRDRPTAKELLEDKWFDGM
ncbi:STE/STE20 protein kinase [Blastomyces gilchristii SLH14081]|uniref:STE/STE20 protein kinase n=1 Tax=Blastomyces gilchristii (strain SLH14081) TaxID=559298 RepID=A0A179UA83_BLAGS|nr:STE/STE20 protein kinase [Blastomyces gilchristii SLH14081]OAT03442.1 STE/STE20 protein kinase [Blastomyces gilchristii SLH14081]